MNAREHGIDQAILQEAADWLMRLHAGDAGPAEWAAIEHWRQRSPVHEHAWQRAEALLGNLRQLPTGPLRNALERPTARRRALLHLAWIPALPTGWLAWRHYVADGGQRWQTATGEQRPLTLADGSQILLNTATEIAVRFDAEIRLIRLLTGEILVTSKPDPQPVARPLVVATTDGRVRAIGTRFSVRRMDDAAASRVTVFEGAVEVTTGGGKRLVAGGQRLVFREGGLGMPESSDSASDDAWTNGMIVARRMRLADLVAELDRYRPGLLRCHPAIAELQVSGTFPALQPERSLDLLAASFPVRTHYRTRYWATVEPV
jgi:transmembrane sensor